MESPFKQGPKAKIRDMLPQGDDFHMIKIDLAHTYSIGYGKDEVASGLVFLAVRCGVFGHAKKYGIQLENAFFSFKEWCKSHGKTSTIKSFAKEDLKIKSLLA